MKYKTFCILLAIQLLCSAVGQCQKIDSLLRELSNHKAEDTIKLKVLNAIAQLYANVKPDKGIEISDMAIALALKLNTANGLATAYLRKSENYLAKGNYAGASELIQQALQVAKKNNLINIISICQIAMGNTTYLEGNYQVALGYFEKVLAANEGSKDERMRASILSGMANNYVGLSNYPKALDLFKSAFDSYERIQYKAGMASVLGNIGLVLMYEGDYPKSIVYVKRSLEMDKELVNEAGVVHNMNILGLLYNSSSDYTTALGYFKKSLRGNEQIGDKTGVIQVLGNMAMTYESQSDYPKALETLQRAVTIATETGNKQFLADLLGNIGVIYEDVGSYDKALEYYNKALVLHNSIGDKLNAALNLANIGVIYGDLEDYIKALEYYQQANVIDKAIGVENALLLHNIAETYNKLKNYYKAYEYLQKSLSISEKSGDRKMIAASLCQIGIVYANIDDSSLEAIKIHPGDRYQKTVSILNKSLDTATKYGILEVELDAWENLSITYEKQKDYSRSLDAYKNFIILSDSVLNNKKKRAINRLSMQYEFDKKKDSLNLEKQVTDEKLKQQTLLAGQQQQQLALNKKELALTNRERDLQKLAYLKTKADLQNEQLEKKGQEKQLALSEKEKQLQQANVKTLTQEKHLDVLKQRQQWIYILGSLILLGLILFYVFYRTRLQQVRLKTEMAATRIEQQQKEVDFQRQLGDISLSALRSQMNPHFIFNCLNSIKLYTTQNDTVAASEYLTKFSRLIRLVLENSRNDRITLTAELDALRLYMEMEAMRFKEKLKYAITVEKNVDMDFIEIPPLLLQPYVENAIWHGLMQKEEGGKIDIIVSMQPGEPILLIKITDDGIGRAKSAELMSKTATKHKSYGMKVTSERLALINRVYKTGANVIIDDLTDANGQSSGTRVTIKIPLD